MAEWRMAFRAGNRGQEMWPECFRRGIAAITYWPLHRTNLAKHSKHEPARLWAQLKPTQKASLGRVVYEIEKGDVIYVKQGPMIVGRGVVRSRYRFDKTLPLKDDSGFPWSHHVRVRWDPSFRPVRMLFGGEQVAVKPLNPGDVRRLNRAAKHAPRHGEIDDEMAAFEGARRREFVVHRKREHSLREEKLAVFQRDHKGRLYCEVRSCGFDFTEAYGDIGRGYAQVHHLYPLSKVRGVRQTRLTDLAVVCANCHAMIHRGGGCRNLESISEALRKH